MEEKNIENNVYYKELEGIPKYVKEDTLYVPFFSEEEQKTLMDIYSRNTNIYNGIVVRLDRMTIDNTACTFNISKIHYFDLLTSNIFNHSPEKWFNKCLNEKELEYCKERHDKLNLYLKDHKNIYDVINNKYLSNVIAVSVLIRDKNGKFGLTKRSTNLNISTSFFSTSVTGDVDEDDFEDLNALLHCAKKEVKEELGLEPREIKLRGIAVSKMKLQPVMLFDAHIGESFEELIDKMKESKDYNYEIEKFLIVSKNDALDLLKREQFTDATRYHIYLNYKD